jgi:hypothetical protein
VLFGSSVKAAQLDVGVEVGGPIVGNGTHPVREYDPLNPGRGPIKTYPNSGDPIFGVHIDIQTPLREEPTDDGVRRIYVDSARFKEAVRDAIRAGGAQGIEPGAAIYCVKTGKEPTGVGTTEANTYAVRYVSAANAQLGTQQQQPQSQPVQQPVQQQQPQYAPQQPQQPQYQQPYYGAPQQQQPQQQYQPGQYPPQTQTQWPPQQQGPGPAFVQAPTQQQQPGGMAEFAPQNGAPQQVSQAGAQVAAQLAGQQYTPEQLAAARAAGATLPGVPS